MDYVMDSIMKGDTCSERARKWATDRVQLEKLLEADSDAVNASHIKYLPNAEGIQIDSWKITTWMTIFPVSTSR